LSFAWEIVAMISPNRIVRLAGVLTAGLLCLASVMPAAAQTAHEHQHAGAAVAKLQRDVGRQWATDDSLRSGMAAIRAAFDADHPAIHAGKETDAEYEALAARIESQVNDIVKNCKLPPAADANLHLVIADLLQGVSLMRGQDPARTRHDGAALVHGALIAYGTYFDDPAWQPDSPVNEK
jgi:septal ring factor EnvC (AmiA/AmiB activator)